MFAAEGRSADMTENLLQALSTRMADAVERAGEHVVEVRSRRWRPASGTVYAPDLVLMAAHALEHEEDVAVQTPDGRTLPAEFAGRDPSTDLAVLRVRQLEVQSMGVSPEPARVGNVVLTVGRAGAGLVAGTGIVHGIGRPRRTGAIPAIEQIIHVDARPYPGFSGGPLVDGEGRALGIATSGLLRGLAVAIPAATAWRAARMLAEHGRIRRGYLGISTQTVRIPGRLRAGAGEYGLLVLGVSEGSPSDQAGILLGDVVIAFAGGPINHPNELLEQLTEDRIGRPAAIEILRAGAMQALQVVIGERNGG
jgi:S1-C subfamily serine protease